MSFEIRRYPKVTVIANESGRKEYITARKASKNLDCNECKEPILKGLSYVRDKFRWFDSRYGYKTHVNFICFNCWRGEVKLISKNKK